MQVNQASANSNFLARCCCALAFMPLALTALMLLPLTAQAETSDPPPAPVKKESLPDGVKISKVEVSPAKIDLQHEFDYRQVLLTAYTSDGDRYDVTRIAKLDPQSEKAVAKVSANGLVRPVADGSGVLRFTVGTQSVDVPVQVSGVANEFTTNFIRDVNPVLSKLGCNQGTCHGAAAGKNGFKLSLRGYDSLFDYRALTDDLAGRRFNRAAPDQSLMLLKPSGEVPHVGGALMKPGEPSYELLRLWITQGSAYDAKTARVTKIAVLPENPVIPLPGMKQQIVVQATYSDGKVRDVTAEAFVESGNIEVTEANRDGVITALRRGEAPVLVRYEGAYAATTITVMGDRTGFVWKDPPTKGYIDELVYQKLKKVKTLPSDICTDAEFIRRLYLDLTGLPPTVKQVRDFLADTRDTQTKRDELVDQLVGSREYVEHWTNKWADLLQVNKKFLGEQGSWALRNWIRQAVATNMPYDEFVRSVLTASGSNLENPPVSYYKILREPDLVMENTTQLFLGVRFSCNKCHDHPFERWTQDQHWQLAAFFAKVARKEDPQFADQKVGGSAVDVPTALVEIIYDGKTGTVKHPNTNAVLTATFPYKHTDMPTAEQTSPRQQFAHWATSPKNEYFAKSYVNRLWSYLLGVGFIEPVDDIRAGNPPTNPELLDRLTKEFIDQQFDMQHMLRLICKSRVYQHSIGTNRWNEDDLVNYSHALARRLPAEVLFDAVHQVTGSIRRLPGMPVGSRAAQQRDSDINVSDGFLNLFGRPARESACECERVGGVMLGQTLNLVNGPTVAQAIGDPANEMTKLVASQPDDKKLIEELFLRVISRTPTDAEVQQGIAALRAEDIVLEKAQRALAELEKKSAEQRSAWEQQLAKRSWQPLSVVSLQSTYGAKLEPQPDGSILVSGPLTQDTFTLVGNSEIQHVTGIRLELLTDPSLPKNGPGRANNGNLVISELAVTTTERGAADQPQRIELQNPVATFSQTGFNIANVIDGKPSTGWAIGPRTGEAHTATFEVKQPQQFNNGTALTIQLDQRFIDEHHQVGRFRLSATQAKPPLQLHGIPDAITEIVAIPAANRTPEQQAALTAYYHQQDTELARLKNAVVTAQKLQVNQRLAGAQDLVWALINSPSFLFNR